MRTPAPTAAPRAARPRQASTNNQSAGPMRTNTSELAFTLPMVRITSANSAGSRHPPRRTARMVKPTSHGRPAQASKSTEIRAVKASWYGVSMYTSAPAIAPAAARAEHPEEPSRTERGGEGDRAQPDALREPVREPRMVEHPVERSHREQVSDDLVRHRAEADVLIPQGRRARQETVGIEVEVLLRVGAHPAG